MAQGLTLDQLQSMGAQPINNIAAPTGTGGFNYATMHAGLASSADSPPTITQKITAAGGGIAKAIAKPFAEVGVAAYNGVKGTEAGLSDYISGESGQQQAQDAAAQYGASRDIHGHTIQSAVPASLTDPNATPGQQVKGFAQETGTGAEIGSTLEGGEGLARDVVSTVGSKLGLTAAKTVAEDAAPQVAKTVAQRVAGIAKGANEAGTYGAVATAGNKAEDSSTYDNGALSATGKIVGAGAEGYAGGAAVGAGLGIAGEGIGAANKLADDVKTSLSKGKGVGKTADIIHADLTPDFDAKTMKATDKVRTADGSTAYRTTEGQGVSGKVKVTQSAAENAAEKEVKNSVPDYSTKRTYRSKAQAVDTAIGDEAKDLSDGKLDKLDTSNPLNKDEAHQVIGNHILQNLQGDAKDAFLEKGKGLEGASERASTVNGRYGQDVRDAYSEYDGTRKGILKLRQAVDDAYKDARGKLAFGDEKLNALDYMNTNLRNALNKELDESSQNAGVTASLKKQSNLYIARDILNGKAAREGQSAIDRTFQKHPSLGFVKRQLERRGVGEAITIGAGALGLRELTKKK